MLLILEFIFFGMGIYGLITAKLPTWFVGRGFLQKEMKCACLQSP